jgi:hypothetical protein
MSVKIKVTYSNSTPIVLLLANVPSYDGYPTPRKDSSGGGGSCPAMKNLMSKSLPTFTHQPCWLKPTHLRTKILLAEVSVSIFVKHRRFSY